MNYEEAGKKLYLGTRVRRLSWSPGHRLYTDAVNVVRIKTADGDDSVWRGGESDFEANNWEIYQEPEADAPFERVPGKELKREPIVALLTDIYATLNKEQYDILPQTAKRRVLNFVIEGIEE